MFFYNFYIFLFCLSVLGSIANGEEDEYPNILRTQTFQQDAPELSNGTSVTSIEKDKVCGNAVTLQKILVVMMSLLRKDLPESSKTAYIVEILKDVLQNTPGHNYEVMYKIDDLIRTIEKYKLSEDAKGKPLRTGLENLNPIELMVRQPTNPNQKIQMSYELPALTNSYCTEALLNIMKITYQSYASLSKNPICNLPALPELPSDMKLPDINPSGKYPFNQNPINFVPNVDVFNPISKNIPVEYKPIYDYHPPNANDEPIDNFEWSRYPPISNDPTLIQPDYNVPFSVPPYINDLTPPRPYSNNPMPYNILPSYPTDKPYFPQNPGQSPFDLTSHNPDNPIYPYNPVLPYPESEPQNGVLFPWQKKWPNLLFGERPNSIPLNPYYPHVKNNPNNLFPLPSEPVSETPEYIPSLNYPPDGTNSPDEIEIFEFPYNTDTTKPYYVNPGSPLVKYPINPIAPDLVTNNDSPGAKVLEFLTPSSPSYGFMPNKPTQDINFKREEIDINTPLYPSIPINQNPAYVPNPSPYDWISKTPTPEMSQNLNLFFPKPVTPQNVLRIPEQKVVKGFIREAIALIESRIPVIKFDPPTLYIIATIKNKLVQIDKDVKTDEYAYILELYEKLINYVKQLNVYKQIIDLVDLSRVTNRSQLETKKVVELTYLVKRPQPVVYYPRYYVKYRLPYPSFVAATQNLLKEKPYLRTNPKKLYEELLALSKVAETSPDLNTYDEKDLLGLTFKSGSLVDAELVKENGTFTKQLNVLRDIPSDLTPEEILELNKSAANKIQLIATNSETSNDHQTDYVDELNHMYENELIKTVKSDDVLKITQKISPPIASVRNNFLSNDYQNDVINPTTKPTDDLTFESHKLRNDILQGDYVGREPIAPALYKLLDATHDATREMNQQNVMNSGDLVNLDNSMISLNTGMGNSQASINISNPKFMINTAATLQNILNSDKTKTSLDVSSQQSSISDEDNQENHQTSTSQGMWSNQKYYYNSGGLVNYDNQKISFNSGADNRQEGVNFINPKMMVNKATNSIFKHTRTSPTPVRNYTDNKTETPDKNFIRVKPAEPYNEATTNYNDLLNYEMRGIGIATQKGNIKVDPKNIEETTRASLLEDLNQPPLYSGTPDKQEMDNFIKNSVKEDIRQFENGEDTNLHNQGERYKQDFFKNYHKNPPNDGIIRLDLPKRDINTFLITGHAHTDMKDKNKITVSDNNQDLINFETTENILSPGTDENIKHTVSFNDNKLYQTNIENQGLGYDFYTGNQQSYEEARPQIANLDEKIGQEAISSQQKFVQFGLPELSGHQAISSHQNLAQFGSIPGLSGQQAISSQQSSAQFGIYPSLSAQQAILGQQKLAGFGSISGLAQQAIANQKAQFGLNPVLSGQQINYVIRGVYKQPVFKRFSAMSSALPFTTRFTRPGIYYG